MPFIWQKIVGYHVLTEAYSPGGLDALKEIKQQTPSTNKRWQKIKTIAQSRSVVNF